MPAGLEIYDENGRLVFDTNSQVVKIFGILNIGGNGSPANGFVDDGRFLLGPPFFQLTENTFWTGRSQTSVQVSITGNRLSWSFPTNARPTTRIIYGIM